MKYLFLMALFVSTFAWAGPDSTPRDRTIKELLVYENSVVVKFSPSFANTQSCSSGSQSHFQLNFNDETGENTGLLSSLLAAASASRKVGFGVRGCAGQYPSIYRVDIVF